jgi:peptidoglycan hydrolase CwlO-like protein
MLPQPAVLPLHSRRRLGRRLGAVAVACVLLSSLATASSASISSRLSDAKRELSTLTSRILSEEAQTRSLQDRLSVLDVQIATATTREQQIEDDLASTRSRIAAATAQEGKLQHTIDGVAQSLFMQGAGSAQGAVLGSILSSRSFSDFSDRLAYASAIGQTSADVANRVANVKVGLDLEAAHLASLRVEQRQLLTQLGQARTSEGQALVAQRAAVADLAATKTRIVSLILKLHKQLRAQELASVGTAFQGSGHVTYGAWAGLFLKTMGVSGCRSNLIAVVSWQYAEFTQAAWNPLATTVPMPGSSVYNSSNVQNYPSLGDGLQATRTTIDQGLGPFGYGAIVTALSGCSDPMTTADAINASSWCAGCAGGTYVTGDISKVEANYALYAAL